MNAHPPPEWVTSPSASLVDAYRWLAGIRDELARASTPELAELYAIGREALFGPFQPPASVPMTERRAWIWNKARARIAARAR